MCRDNHKPLYGPSILLNGIHEMLLQEKIKQVNCDHEFESTKYYFVCKKGCGLMQPRCIINFN